MNCFLCLVLILAILYYVFIYKKMYSISITQNKTEPFESGGTNIQLNSNFSEEYPELLPSYYPYPDEKTYLEQQQYNPQNFEKNPYNINQYEVTNDYLQYQK
jgi:hypothetical protein